MATKWKDLRDNVVRRELRDESETSPVFTDAELMTYYKNAIRTYSGDIPREVISTLNLTAGLADYDIPAGCREIVEITDGTTDFEVSSIFAGVITLSSAPASSGSATIKYRGVHSVPDDENDTSSYVDDDEALIVKLVKAQAYEVLAGDGAKYYRYVEGDITEEQGKTQAQFRAEADALLKEYADEIIKAKEAADALKIATAPMVAGVISREKAVRQTGIYKTG